ncbi:MAG: dehydrogenase [Propionibacteriaceae bacterium]|jgi:2-oxoisovalerate dehydrogenase E1 component|nr:dehydrogenase [Propionibacteriaceae bacterium]
MTKSLVVNPFDVRAPGKVRTPEIPVNAYQLDLPSEATRYGQGGLINVLHDMIVIREFESMLHSLKTTGAWSGVFYEHSGPAHLSTGQEAAAVGQALELGPEDLIFGSHRSHGEVLAKSFSAARRMDPSQVRQIMESFLEGETLHYAESLPHASETDLHTNFILFGTLAEIFARRAGFNRGMGGSMHAFFPPFGSMPNNAIVGGSATIAVGAALYKRINQAPGIVVANLGDASMGCGPVWEAMMLAAMDQYQTLWPESAGGAPPILFNFFNNFYGMGGQTAGETMGYDILARVGAGINADALNAERVDGYNPLAVANAVRRKKEILLAGEGPVLLDVITYRTCGHSPSDPSSYRTREEVEMWEQADSIEAYGQMLISAGLLPAEAVDQMRAKVSEQLRRVVELAADDQRCPRPEVNFFESVMFSNTRLDTLSTATPQLSEPLGSNDRMNQLAEKVRSATDPHGMPVSKHKVFQFRDGLFEALAHRFCVDPTLAAWGEDTRDWGGAFGVYRGLTELLGYPRLFNTPVSEAAIVGAGVGYAMAGGRAVVELMYCDFLGRAGDEVFNQLAKWSAMSAGLLKLPVVVRVSVGNKYGAQHSQDWSSLLAHIPGLKVYYPATPTDAKGMLNLALSGTDPVIFLESQKLYDKGEEFEAGGVPEGYYETREGTSAIRRQGSDITIATLGPALYTAIDAAHQLQNRFGLSAEVVDLRFVVPLDYEVLLTSVRKTGRLVLVSDAVERGSFLHTVAHNLTQVLFDELDAPAVVLGSRNHITPAPELEDLFFPGPETILDAIHTRIQPLPGYQLTSNQSVDELLRRSRGGV